MYKTELNTLELKRKKLESIGGKEIFELISNNENLI